MWYTYVTDLQICCLNLLMSASRLSRPWTVIFINELATYFDRALSPWRFYDKFTSKLERKMKINAFKCWKWQLKWYNYMNRSYSFQNPRAFPMACATFETTAQKTLGTLACRDIWWSSFRWNASLGNSMTPIHSSCKNVHCRATGRRFSDVCADIRHRKHRCLSVKVDSHWRPAVRSPAQYGPERARNARFP